MVEVLLTGATGHVGGRLLPALETDGRSVRCLSRHPERLESKVGARTEVVEGDVNDGNGLRPALAGVRAAYYLVHSLNSTGSFSEDDREAAETFAAAAAEAGVERLIYLGGLGASDDDLSPHLESRHEVGEVLRSTGIPTTEFRASIVVGAGSASFELAKEIVEKLPVLPLPDWVKNDAQPIATDDVVSYLRAALDGAPRDRVYEIGGADRVYYLDLLEEIARQLSLRRLFVPLPVLVGALVSPSSVPGEWLGAVAPDRARVAAHLIESMQFATVADDEDARAEFGVQPVGVEEAVRRALSQSIE